MADVCLGDKVQYTAKFLRDIGVFSGDMAHATGTVVRTKTFSGCLHYAIVEWDRPDMPTMIRSKNLKRVDALEVPA
jgi:hypothetical protein